MMAPMTDSDTYRWFFLRSPMLATLIDAEGRYEDVNEAIATRLGYTRDEMIGRRPAEFVTADTATRIEKEFVPALRRTGRLENKPVTFLGKAGKESSALPTRSSRQIRVAASYATLPFTAKYRMRQGRTGNTASCIAPRPRCCTSSMRRAA